MSWRPAGSRLSRWAPVLVALVACGHSASYLVGSYAETGPFIPGPEARIAGGAMTWTEDGAGLIFANSCYGYSGFVNTKRYPPAGVRIAGIDLLSAQGGSVRWERCEVEIPFVTSSDSDVAFESVAMGKGGRLLYTEYISAHEYHDGFDKFPLYFHIDLLLGDSANPLNANRKLLSLFRERTGVANVPPAGINQLTRLAWIGANDFIGEGYQYRVDRSSEYLGLIHGTVTHDSAVLTPIPGTTATGTHRWTMADGGATIVYVDDSLTVRRLPLGGGASTVAAVIPAAGRRYVLDVSCRGDLCLVLTSEDALSPPRSSTFWTVTLSTGAVQLVRTDLKAYLSAQLSPASNVVLVRESDGMHLFSELLH